MGNESGRRFSTYLSPGQDLPDGVGQAEGGVRTGEATIHQEK